MLPPSASGMRPTLVCSLGMNEGCTDRLLIQYAQPVTKKGAKKETAETAEEKKLSNHAQRSLEEKRKGARSGHFMSGTLTYLLHRRRQD